MRALFTFTLISLFLILASQDMQAQRCARWKGHQSWQLRTGLGLLPTFYKDNANSEIPPLSIELRYRPSPIFSVGLLAGGSRSSATLEHHTGSSMVVRNQFQMLAARAAVHSQRWERWAPYGGISLGYQYNKITEKESKGENANSIYYTPRKSGFFYGAFVGTCYQPTPQIEIFGELSYGLSLITLGAGFSW